MKRTFLVTTLMGLLIASQLSFAQPRNQCNQSFQPERIKALLELSDSQFENIREKIFNLKEEGIDVRAELEKNRLKIQHILRNYMVDTSELIALTSKNDKLRSAHHQSKIKLWVDIYDSLDEVQKEKWARTFNKFMSKKKGMGNFSSMRNNCNKDMGRKMRKNQFFNE